MSLEIKIIMGALLLLAFVVLAAVVEIQHQKLASQAMQIAVIVNANHNNQAALEKAQSALKSWQDQAATQLKAEQEAVKDANARVADIQARADRLAAMEIADAKKPDCEKLLNTDVAAVCPQSAAVERLRFANSLSRQARKNSNP